METEIRTKERRLLDIDRGKRYFRKIGDLASQQWGTNVPKEPITRTHFIATKQSKPHHSLFAHDGEISNIKGRIHSDGPSCRYNKDLSKTRRPRVQSERLPSTRYNRYTDNGNFSKKLFNQWGSGVNPLDDKLTLTKADLEPKFELSFRFRDEKKIVQKPIPKKGIPMSRVVKDCKERQLKTLTGFHSSKNGFVSLIHPVGPIPELEKQQTFIGQASLQREKTDTLLKRIEQLIHPNKHVMKCDLDPSEEVIQSSKSPTLSDDSFDLQRNASFDLQRNACILRRGPELSDVPNRTKKFDDNSVSQMKRNQGRFESSGNSINSTIDKLNKNEMDVNRKCRLWIDKWIDE